MNTSEPPQPQPTAVPKLLLSMREAAQAMGISYWQVDAMTLSGQIPSIRVGKRVLIPVKWLEDWIDRQATEPDLPQDYYRLSGRGARYDR